MNRNEPQSLSEKDFITLLLSKLKDKSWTLAELYEVESRGGEFLSKHLDLRNAIDEVVATRLNSLRDSLKPTLQAINQIQDSRNAHLARMTPNLSQEALRAMNHLEELKILDQPVGPIGPSTVDIHRNLSLLKNVTGPLPVQVSNLEAKKENTNLELMQASIINLFQESVSVNKKIHDALTRDLVFWLIFVIGLISAGSSVWMLIIEINRK